MKRASNNKLLEHDNQYVRQSTASAIAEAVEQWAQQVETVLVTLREFYREKAKVLAPEYDQYVGNWRHSSLHN